MKDGGKGQLLVEKLSKLVMMNSFSGHEIDMHFTWLRYHAMCTFSNTARPLCGCS